jgi:hypothetical protein
MFLYSLLLFTGLLQNLRDTSFIEHGSEVISPNKKLEVHLVWERRNSSCDEFLVLKDFRTDKEKIIYSSRINVCCWSPNSKCLAGYEYISGGQGADCIILRLYRKVQKINVTNRLIKIPELRRHFAENERVYVIAEKWVSNSLLKININGYGDFDKNGFNLWYEYDLAKDAFKKVDRTTE